MKKVLVILLPGAQIDIAPYLPNTVETCIYRIVDNPIGENEVQYEYNVSYSLLKCLSLINDQKPEFDCCAIISDSKSELLPNLSNALSKFDPPEIQMVCENHNIAYDYKWLFQHSNKLYWGCEWYALEQNYPHFFRWGTDVSSLWVKNGVEKLRLTIHNSPHTKNTHLTAIVDGEVFTFPANTQQPTMSIDLNVSSINYNSDYKPIHIVSKTFIPKDIDPASGDVRELGIQLLNLSIFEQGEWIEYPTHKVEQIHHSYYASDLKDWRATFNLLDDKFYATKMCKTYDFLARNTTISEVAQYAKLAIKLLDTIAPNLKQKYSDDLKNIIGFIAHNKLRGKIIST